MELRPYQEDLIKNIRHSIQTGHKSVCAVLGCGGGKSVIQGHIASMAIENGNEVLFLVHRKELCTQITGTFEACGVDLRYCNIGMVQTITRRLPKIKKPKLIITDECHHALSKSYRNIYDYFPDAKLVGFTATPARMNEGGLGDVFEDLIESVSTKWLIENKYLAPYKYYGVQLADTSRLRTKNGDFDKRQVEELMNRSVIFGDAVTNWLKLAQGMKTIVYCNSIEASKNATAQYNEAGISAAHLDGTTPKSVREETVERFRKGEITVLCNVDLFGEGFDVPDCEAVQLLRPTKSLTLHIQQSMRSMRYNPARPDKVAIILDHVGNYTRHGLPDEIREWSLETKKQKEKSKVKIKQCPVCFAVISATATECPFCGHIFKAETREAMDVVEGVALEEIASRPYNDYKKCRSFDELERFRKAKEYSFMWSLHKAIELRLPVPGKIQWLMRKRGLIH